jgi:hypothetical protein
MGEELGARPKVSLLRLTLTINSLFRFVCMYRVVFLIKQAEGFGKELVIFFSFKLKVPTQLELIIDSFSASLETVAVTVLCLYVTMFMNF